MSATSRFRSFVAISAASDWHGVGSGNSLAVWTTVYLTSVFEFRLIGIRLTIAPA
jgi:hypothetical protein